MILWVVYWLLYRNVAKGMLPLLSVVLLLGTVYLNRTAWIPGDYDTPIPAPSGAIRVLHANVLYSREEYATTVAMLKKHQSDLYVLQEMTPGTIRLVTAQVRTEFPYWVACPSKQQVWTLVGSRTPFRIDQALARQRHIIALETAVRGQQLSVITVHPHTPVVPSWFTERNEQLAYAARKTRFNALPTILIGDFNITPFSPIYKDLFQPVAPTTSLQADKQWPLTAARQTRTQPTWPRSFPAMMIPIDHAFINKGFTTQSFRTLDQPGSDHRALVVDLNLR
ncbi:hypothetical protein GCM10028825_16280 [Spirosoma agri]